MVLGGEIPVVSDSTPPSHKLPPGEWVKKNLFSSPFNSLITLVVGGLAALLAFFAIRWLLNNEYEILRVNVANFMAGRFPRDELWRLWASGYLFLFAVALTAGAISRSTHELALTQELPTEKETLVSFLRRFWAIIAVMLFFVLSLIHI